MPPTLELKPLLKKAHLAGLLERLCQQLELTKTQFETAETRYQAVGNWLDKADHIALRTSTIYPQGSVGLGTTVKPVGQDEFDVDLVCHLPELSTDIPPSLVKAFVGARLKEHGVYREILKEKPRCWRLDYASEFHLDITPSIPNSSCPNGGELVPDKQEDRWKETNPKGYRSWFEKKAELKPRLQLRELAQRDLKAQIETLPQPSSSRGILRRTVQLCKRHRDIWASRNGADLAPISIILTTLAAKAYEYCVVNCYYDTDLDLLLDVVSQMPSFIQVDHLGERSTYTIWNETTAGENFAEKWNHKPRLADAFYTWHRSAVAELQNLPSMVGMNDVRRSLSESFGERVIDKTFESLISSTEESRKAGHLSVVPGVGLTVGSSTGTRVGSNTFYGE